jgi:hypothetical protein
MIAMHVAALESTLSFVDRKTRPTLPEVCSPLPVG